MRPNTLRTALWLVAALAAAALAVGLRAAGLAANPAPALIVTILAELAIAITGYFVFAGRSRQPSSHTRRRWAYLDAIRMIALMLFAGFLVGLLVADFAGVALSNRWIQLALLAPLVAGIACLAGALGERERVRVNKSGGAPAGPRKLYETRHGAVLVEESGGTRQIILTGAEGRRDVSAVARAIDQRGWREGETPAPMDLNSALERWGILGGNTE